MFVREADEATASARATATAGRRRAAATATWTTSALERALRGRHGPTPPGSAGASSPSIRSSRSCASAWASSSSAPTPTSCGAWATRSRPSAWPRQAGVPVAPWSGGPVADVEEALDARPAHRLPADGQGGGRRRWTRHPPRRVAGRSSPRRFESARAEAREAFGDRRVLLEKVVDAGPPRRGAGHRRRPRDGVGGGRARLLACSGATRRSSRSRPAPRSPPSRTASCATPRVRLALRGRLPQRRHGRVPLRARERALLVHGGQHPPAGGAPRHRGDHRRSTWSSSSSTSPPAGGSRASRRRHAATRSRPG